MCVWGGGGGGIGTAVFAGVTKVVSVVHVTVEDFAITVSVVAAILIDLVAGAAA